MADDLARARAVDLRCRLESEGGAGFVVAAFAASRYFYYAKGVRFDTSPIDYFAQLLDRALLRNRLGESLLYLHSQPPLYNLLTGVALKIAPDRPELLLAPLFLAAGLYTALCLYFILLRLRVQPWLGAVLAAAIVTSPPFVLYENWYFYPHLDVAWLVGAVAWLAQSRGRPGAALVVSAVHLAGLSLTRSLFHPAFFGLAAVLMVALVAPGARRRASVCFLFPGLALVAWCAKNLVLFGFFGTSSWGSRNISQSVVDLLGATRVEAEARLGRLSPAAGLHPFEPGERNVLAFGLADHATGVPALDNTRKANPSVLPMNYNHWSYPQSARYYAADTRHLLATYPVAYLHGIAEKSTRVFFSPVDRDGFMADNRSHIADAAQSYDNFDRSDAARWVLAIGLALAAFGAPSAPRAKRLIFALSFLAMAWVTAVGIFGDYGENYRFRYKVVWLAWAIALAGYSGAIRAAKSALEQARRAGI